MKQTENDSSINTSTLFGGIAVIVIGMILSAVGLIEKDGSIAGGIKRLGRKAKKPETEDIGIN